VNFVKKEDQLPRRLPRTFFPSFQLGRVGIARGAGAENPPDHDADEQDRRNENEVTGGHRFSL
jgi:hypothetical protein